MNTPESKPAFAAPTGSEADSDPYETPESTSRARIVARKVWWIAVELLRGDLGSTWSARCVRRTPPRLRPARRDDHE